MHVEEIIALVHAIDRNERKIREINEEIDALKRQLAHALDADGPEVPHDGPGAGA